MPETRRGAKCTPEDTTTPVTPTNLNMAAGGEPTLKDIFDMVKNTNQTVTTMEIRLKNLEEEGNPEMKKLSAQIDDLTKSVNNYTDQVTLLETTVNEQKQQIKTHTEKVKDLEREKRAHNLILEGIPEAANENVRATVDNLLRDLGLDFGEDWCDSIYRKGTRGKQTTGRPRPILVSFPYIRLKHMILRNAYKLKELPHHKNTYLSDDISVEQQGKRRDLRCLHAYAKSMNIDSKLRPDAIVVDGTRYTHEDINKLPHEISLENAKIIEVEDGYAFQSEHAYLSSLYEVEITFNDKKHRSAEHAFHFTRADENNQPEMAVLILEAKTSRDAMNIGRRIKTSDEYKQAEPALLQRIHLAKFQQHPVLRAKLIQLKGNLYEATYHPVYGAGFSLAQRHLIKKANVQGSNKLGLSLENIRSSLIEQEGGNT